MLRSSLSASSGHATDSRGGGKRVLRCQSIDYRPAPLRCGAGGKHRPLHRQCRWQAPAPAAGAAGRRRHRSHRTAAHHPGRRHRVHPHRHPAPRRRGGRLLPPPGPAHCQCQWGNAPSVLVGDFLYSRAFQLLVAIGDLAVMRLLSDTTNRIAEGEVLQLTRAGDPDTSEASYFDIIERKTAVLFAAACSGAARLNQSPDETSAPLHRYGLHLGNAFQLADDLLDYTGDPELMGKQLGDDLAEGKPTLPLIYTLTHGNPGQRSLVAQAIRQRQREQLPAIIQAVTDCGALDYTFQRAESEADQALAQLDALPDSPFRQALQRLAELAVERDR